jgi:hypothetical protein
MKYAKNSGVLVIAASVLVGWLACALHFGCHKSSANQPTAFHREQAIGSLKQDRVYGSLQAAVSAARYRIYADEKREGAFYAKNSAQQISAYIGRDSLRLTVGVEF